jgi:hypothetical protein
LPKNPTIANTYTVKPIVPILKPSDNSPTVYRPTESRVITQPVYRGHDSGPRTSYQPIEPGNKVKESGNRVSFTKEVTNNDPVLTLSSYPADQRAMISNSMITPQKDKISNSTYIEPQQVENINTVYHKRSIYKSTLNENMDDVLRRISSRQSISSGIHDSALIAPKNEVEGWITSVGIDNPSLRGIHSYLIENDKNNKPEVKSNQILHLEGERSQIIGICYLKSLDLLYYHKMNGEVTEFNPRTKTHN